MQAGQLNHLITIQYNAAADEDNPPSPYDWQPLCTVHANEKGARGKLYFAAAAAQLTGDVLFTIRYRTDLAKAQQIVETVGGVRHTYKINSLPKDPYGSRQWLEIHAEEELQNGS